MLVLHGFWLPDVGMVLWAEDSQLPVKSGSQALRSARPHPFAAPFDAIDALHPGKPGEVTLLLLPSLRTAPLDSPVVILDPAAALTALAGPAPGVRCGQSIGYLAHMATFADDLVSRGRVLPAVVRDADGAAARWRPMLQGPDVVA